MARNETREPAIDGNIKMASQKLLEPTLLEIWQKQK